jgi:hypothetical protein
MVAGIELALRDIGIARRSIAYPHGRSQDAVRFESVERAASPVVVRTIRPGARRHASRSNDSVALGVVMAFDVVGRGEALRRSETLRPER